MRIWDIDPGFLNNGSLLGEHRELHAIFSIITNSKKGYSRHPETLRWKEHIGALTLRHEMLAEEMKMRGLRDKTPLTFGGEEGCWPGILIDPPGRQYKILKEKYVGKREGRIPLPKNTMALWASHKYSIMARDMAAYHDFGKGVAEGRLNFSNLAERLMNLMREPPASKLLINTLSHMWGYISDYTEEKPQAMGHYAMLKITREKAVNHNVLYLLHSTALVELGVWCRRRGL